MQKLLNMYGFNSDMQYFERIVTLYKNNDERIAKVMFLDMPKREKIVFLKSATIGGWESGLDNEFLDKLFSAL